MRFQVVTLFPEMIERAISFGVVGQAVKEGRVLVSARSPREFTEDVHQTVDDRPFGGGDGMVMMAEPVSRLLETMTTEPRHRRVIHLSPRGRKFSDAVARELTGFEELVLISSRYGGIDERLLEHEVDEEISVGDYVLSGGEIPVLVVIDAVSRLLPGVLGNQDSSEFESFRGSRLEQPQYTRPRDWRGRMVPEVLLSGHHGRIEEWKLAASLLVTLERRPDLIESISPQELRSAQKLVTSLSPDEARALGLRDLAAVQERLEAYQRTVTKGY